MVWATMLVGTLRSFTSHPQREGGGVGGEKDPTS